ncbi:MarR family winged helix-turn-helix transcriptional regulator [Methylopila turkensis]|uniref:MarR family transcriptional regulator n=1 Tax=Methylopila turkensis TaxID=1437816 RepID=A0A9W6N639_9HYPH|nr:MarR family transcriptional regulator [Methylopila turkensis]GLK78926.1 MarR family transcriptional regulator [Methylopila turkensis]
MSLNDGKAIELFARPGFLVRRLHQIYVAIYLQECEAFGTTPVQTSVMQVAHLNPGIDQAKLAAEIGVDRTTTSNVLARLERRALVRRESDLRDKRLRRVFLEAAGETLLAEMRGALDRAHGRLIAPLPAEEREAFTRTLRRLVEANNLHSRTSLRIL